MNRELVFIRGATGCGSTALAMQLDRHPACTTVPAYYVLPEELLDWTELHLAARLPQVDGSVLSAACRGFLDGYVGALTNADGILVHKSTMRADRLQDLLTVFPGAKLIYLVRDPIGAVQSIINVNIRERDPFRTTVVTAALRWHAELDAVYRSGVLDDPRVLAVHYADLVHAPEATLERVHAFLGVEPIPDRLSKAPNRYARRFVLDDSERAWIAEATRSLCAQLGISGVALERSAPAGSSEGQADHADRRLAAPPDTLDLDRLLRRAWREAFVAGGERIAVYGLGALTRLAMPTLTDLEPAPIAILDESRHVGGAALTSGPGMPQAIPVHHASRAGDLDLGAAVAMSFEYRDALLRQWTERWSAIPIVPLWRTACSASVGASTPSRMEASP